MSCGIPAPASWAYALQYPALAGQAYAFGYLDAGSLRVLQVILLSRQAAVKADLRPAAVVVIAVECRGLKTIIAENFSELGDPRGGHRDKGLLGIQPCECKLHQLPPGSLILESPPYAQGTDFFLPKLVFQNGHAGDLAAIFRDNDLLAARKDGGNHSAPVPSAEAAVFHLQRPQEAKDLADALPDFRLAVEEGGQRPALGENVGCRFKIRDQPETEIALVLGMDAGQFPLLRLDCQKDAAALGGV